MRFGENVLGPKYNDIYKFQGFAGGRGVKWSTLHFLFIIHKNGKSTRAWPILKSNSTTLWFLKKFPRVNNKNFRKRGQQGALLLFIYEVSIVVLIDFIAIPLTPGIILIQIANTNNTNMYVIHFNSNNNNIPWLSPYTKEG